MSIDTTTYGATITVYRYLGRTPVDILDIPLIAPEDATQVMEEMRQAPGQAMGAWMNGLVVIRYDTQTVRFLPEHAEAALVALTNAPELVAKVLTEAWALAQWDEAA